MNMEKRKEFLQKICRNIVNEVDGLQYTIEPIAHYPYGLLGWDALFESSTGKVTVSFFDNDEEGLRFFANKQRLKGNNLELAKSLLSKIESHVPVLTEEVFKCSLVDEESFPV